MNKRIPLMIRVILLPVLLLLFGSCINQANQPTYLLLFNERIEEVSKIYSMYPDGSHITQVIEIPAFSPYWLSPNGVYLAFLVGNKLTIINNLTGASVAEVENVGTNVSEHFVEEVVWSPDSGKFVFITDSVGKQGTDLWLYDLSSGLEIPLTSDESIDLEPAWSSDGQNIAFITHQACDGSAWNCPPEQEYWDVVTVNVSTLVRQKITAFKDSQLIPPGNRWYALLCNLSWSPDGKYVVFENACSQPGLQWWKQVFVASTNGSGLFQLTHFSEYDPGATQFPVSILLYSTHWIPSGNTLLISYTEAELIENGKRTNGFFLVSENEFSDPDNQSQSGVLGSNATWSPNGEYVIGNTASILGFPLERPFIGRLDNHVIAILTLPESLPYGSCYENGAYWSPDSQYVVYLANRQGGACSYESMEAQDIAVLSVSGTSVVSTLISLSENSRPIGWLTLP